MTKHTSSLFFLGNSLLILFFFLIPRCSPGLLPGIVLGLALHYYCAILFTIFILVFLFLNIIPFPTFVGDILVAS
jgi:hypothetical protein